VEFCRQYKTWVHFFNEKPTGLGIPENQEIPRAMDADEIIEKPSWFE
jgi:hypothetical protein